MLKHRHHSLRHSPLGRNDTCPRRNHKSLQWHLLATTSKKTDVLGLRLAREPAGQNRAGGRRPRERSMLRITTHSEPSRLTFQLEGKLAGPWVRELDAC